MKKIICICIVCLYLGMISYSQEITKLHNSVPVKKGKLTLKNGTIIRFNHLKVNDRFLNFTDLNGKLIEKNISEVSKIAKRKSCAGTGALVGGALTLALIINNEITESNNQNVQESSHSEYVEFGIFFVGMGTLIGSFFKKYIILYEDKSQVSISPAIISSPDGKNYAAISLKFNINFK